MRSKSILILMVTALSLGCGAAFAQTPKYGVINMQDALASTKDGQKAINDLKAKFTPKEQEFQKRQAELQSKQDEYRKGENTMSDDKKAALAREIDTVTKNLQRDTDDTRQDVDQEQQRMINELGSKMMQIIQKYATDKGYTMIFDDSGQPNNILFASNTIEITREIVALYDAAGPMTTATPLVKPTPTARPPATTTSAPASAPKKPAPTTPPATK
ncbi:MAG TPA: OmpH family outer membrane protein [Bryobacteraceae bacterium]|nr:OmpH family outer membrane protein [Bryobacteraceae bacterium]